MSSKISDDTDEGGDKDFGEKLADLNVNGSYEGKNATGENDGDAEGNKDRLIKQDEEEAQ